MKIYDMKTNHLDNPLGFYLPEVRLSYKVDCPQGKYQQAARITIARAQDGKMIYDSGLSQNIDSLCFVPDVSLEPRTRYQWQVFVKADNGQEALSPIAFFETGKKDEPWQGQWIASTGSSKNTQLFKAFSLAQSSENIATARLYICGLGLYEAYINGEKAGDEYLAPACNNYAEWLQYQTYDIASLLKSNNRLHVLLGDGWYKGPFTFAKKEEIYGDTQVLLAEAHITYTDGTSQVITTDTTWLAQDSPVREATIYNGETYDATFMPQETFEVEIVKTMDYQRLMERLSPPIRIVETLAPVKIIQTPNGETVLDMGQIITGHLQFFDRGQKGQAFHLQYGEILQNGSFYNDNLRSAKQEYHYTSNGKPCWVRPHFTFYGFRFVKLVGFINPQLSDFKGCVIYSDISQTGFFESSNPKVNRLALNALWGQKGNFLDVPTDCPQRDERMGWTGDAQAFAATACYQMDSAAFFTKYLYDMATEQKNHDGAVPHFIPAVGMSGTSSCAWADAATIIPWTLYTFYGDKALLAHHYSTNMVPWVNWIKNLDDHTGSKRLWHCGFHFADWLALDSDHLASSSAIGGTDSHYIASCYYLYSTRLTAKAAWALGKTQEGQAYDTLAEEILTAMRHEYITATGRLAVTTQTAYILALMLGLGANKQEITGFRKALNEKFSASHGELRTGFVGTAYLCRVLTANGLGHMAYSLFLREEYPSWLYEVNMGATTVWERWNSVLPSGNLSDTGMNSLNHYAYGSVMEWIYRDVAAISPVEDAPGFRKVRMAPHFDSRLPQGHFRFDSPLGFYESRWNITGDKSVEWTVTVPFGGQAQLILPLGTVKESITFTEEKGKIQATLPAGTYTFYVEFAYSPWETLPMNRPFSQLLEDERFSAQLKAVSPNLERTLAQKGDSVTFQNLKDDSFSLMTPAELLALEEVLIEKAFAL